MTYDPTRECTLFLSPSGGLTLRTPQGRTLDFGDSTASLRLLKQTLQNARNMTLETQAAGHCRNFPTQHVVDAWLREDREREASRTAQALGVDLGKVEFQL
jgi:hypothetical protein